MKMPSENLVKRRVTNALEALIINDKYLILKNVSERSITHKLAEYLQQLFRSWHVDCEYNKFGSAVKSLPLQNDNRWVEDSPVYPDIIIHRRGLPEDQSNPPHCLVIEARKAPASIEKICRDKEKIARYMDAELRYRYGLLIEFYVTGENAHYNLEWR